ncbi:pentatricopeptide repeat-containing protein [Quercus suber]|uniref:Pentatricopeptide repeat-containing protein n=1 Tax=Quercus suber TaxID=58331 RepID=A0AAW0KIA4_QUESU
MISYGQRGRVGEARHLFDQIPFYGDRGKKGSRRFERNVVSWNSMIMCYVKAEDIASAREIFDQMTERDIISWNTMISGYVHSSNMEEASYLFGKMPNPDTLSWNTMVSGFAEIGSLEQANDFFRRMPQKNLVSWNSMIAGYEKNENYKGAIKLFSQMLLAGEKPDRHTLSSVLSVSTGLVDLHLGMQIHQLVAKTVIPDLPINNSLITMYSRCGAINEAQTIFDEMKLWKDVISWNAMIGGYASHGFSEEALELFKLMKRLNVQPTYITFISVLNACANAGLVEEGRKQFKSMSSEYGIEPRVEHFATLVDIVGRHGQLEEAMDLINSMPCEPDTAVWGALLGACRVHHNVELARVAAEALMRLEPESSAPYVLLYNMYADAGQWDNAAEVRMMMENNNIRKQPGYSWDPILPCLFCDEEKPTKIKEQKFLDIIKHALSAAEDPPIFDTLLESTAEIMIAVDIYSQLFLFSLFLLVDQLDNPHVTVRMNVSRTCEENDSFVLPKLVVSQQDNEQAIETLYELAKYLNTDMVLLIVNWLPKVLAFALHQGDGQGLLSALQFYLAYTGSDEQEIFAAALPALLDELVCFLDEGGSDEIRKRLARVPQMIKEVARVLTDGEDLPGFLRNHFVGLNIIDRKMLHAEDTSLQQQTLKQIEILIKMMGSQLSTSVPKLMVLLMHAIDEEPLQRLVEEGWKQFKSMSSEFGIEPRVEHFATLVDIMGRHGQLEEAMDLINSMPCEPDTAVWGALLGACRVHRNVELARVAAEALMRLEPESSAPYVLLYDMYADAGQWDNAAEVRMMMENNNIRKQPGYSWVYSSHN